ncbi:uroporphyrinogen decarboxylase [Sungkyunkwania multivorans]|uniref:Uroporphyrinogen decarboxylase n=1 Tax=Sungkyunkwania multivorans TaxID=1173618 RepID=A0ABW3CSD1_9FLAO
MELLGISITEWVGYLASALVLLSFLMKAVTKLRLVNMVGCVCWVIYGFMLDVAWPVIITNASIFLVNGYYLFNKKVV